MGYSLYWSLQDVESGAAAEMQEEMEPQEMEARRGVRDGGAPMAEAEASLQREMRLSAEAERLRVEAQETNDEAELRRTLSDIAKASSPREAARLAAQLRISSDGGELRSASAAPDATVEDVVPEGVPHKGQSYLVVTHTRFSRRVQVGSFADQQEAQTAFDGGSKVDSRLLLKVGAEGQLQELQAWAVMREAVRRECLHEARRWLRHEEFRLMERPEDGGKQGVVKKQTGKSFLHEGRWDPLFLSMRDRVLIAHDSADAVGTAPLMALPAHDCKLGLPKSQRKDRPYCFRVDLDPECLQRAASDDRKLIFDPGSEEEMHAWIMTFGRAGAQVPSSYRQKIYIEDATLKLPPGGMMDWVSIMTDPTRPTAPWQKLWCEWRFPVISLHNTPGGEPVAVIDAENYELVVGPADDVHTASLSALSRTNSGSALSRTGSAQLHSTDDLDRAFSWVLKQARGAELGQVAVEPEPEPEPEPELEPGLEPEDTDGFEIVDVSVCSSNFYGSRSDDLSWIGLAAGSGQEMRAWVTALQVPHAAHSLPAARASKHLAARSYNALLVQYGSSQRLDLASEDFQSMTLDQVQELIELCPQVCPDLTTLFVPESILRMHWDMFREGLPSLQRIVRGITIDAHDGIIAQAQRGSRLDLTGAEFAKTTLVGLMHLRGDCAHIESIFFVKDREHTNSTFPRGPFCICNPETGKMLKIKNGGVEAVHDEGQVWEYNPRNKQLQDKDTQLVLTIRARQLSMCMPTDDKGQEWVYQAEDKAIVNPSSGSVLDIAGGVDGTRVIGFASHGGANQTWTLLHDDDTGGRHNIQDASQVTLSEDETDKLKQEWPKLQVAFLGREISATTFDAMMLQYQESGRIDLTGDGFANLSGLGMLELCDLCPKPSKIFLHSKHSISSLHIKEVKRQLSLGDDVIVERDIKLSDCVRLQVKQAAEVDHRTVQTMVTPRSLPDELEMQEEILQRQSSRHACFRCGGTGLVRESRSAVTISFATLEQSSEEVTCTWLFKDAHGSWNLYDKSTTAMLEREWRDAAAITDGQFPVVQLYHADRVVYEVDMNAMIQTNLITGVVRTVKRADEAFGEAGHPCWVCRGTGSTTKWLKEFDSQSVEVEHNCMICYDEASYGLSTECGHFYCESCIRRSLDAMMDTAQFPAFCPQCRVDATDAGEELTVGRILPDALSFLEQRKVITRDFLFRFQKQNGGGDDEEKYFACPAKCGRFLIEEAVEFRTDKAHGIPVMRLGACPCGACICLQCKLEEHTSATTHQCPSVKGGAEIDAASLALVTKAGKKCPKCKSFVQRTEGCHVMMCGTNAHGKVADALRNGGCAHIFDWNTLLALNDGYGFTDMDGSKARGNPLTARQLPKDEQKKCERPGCPFMFHADAKNNGGTHCCAACKAGGGHGPLCHRLLFEAPAKELAAVETGGSAGGDVGFTTAHETIELTQGGTIATKASGAPKEYQAAFCTDKIMGELKQPGTKSSERFQGKHSATFTIMSGTAIVGVANPEVLQASEWRPGGAEGGATCGEHGWGYVSICGDQKHNGQLSAWDGQQGAKQGDEITLYLDLDVGEVWVALKQATPDAEITVLGRMTTGLSGPLIWMAELCNEGASVSVKIHSNNAIAPTSFTNLPLVHYELQIKLPKYRRQTKDEKLVIAVSSTDKWEVVVGQVQSHWGISRSHFHLELSSPKSMLGAGSQIGLMAPCREVIVRRNIEFDLAKAAQFLSADSTNSDVVEQSEDITLEAAQALIGIVSARPPAAEKHIDVVVELVAALPHVNHCDKFRSTALIEACDHGNADFVAILLAAQAAVDHVDNGNRTALHWAAMRGHTEVVGQLIATAGQSNGITNRSFMTQSTKGFTPLALAKLKKGKRHQEVVVLLEEAMSSGDLGAELDPEPEPEPARCTEMIA